MKEYISTDLYLSNVSLANHMQQSTAMMSKTNLGSALFSQQTILDTPNTSTREPSTFAKKSVSEPENMSTISPDISKSYQDVNNMSEYELRKIVEIKMSKMNLHDRLILNKREKIIFKKFNLNLRTLEIIIRCQKKIRSFLMKRKFFRALRMNDLLENKQNCLELSKSLRKFKKKIEDSRTPFHEGILDFIM